MAGTHNAYIYGKDLLLCWWGENSQDKEVRVHPQSSILSVPLSQTLESSRRISIYKTKKLKPGLSREPARVEIWCDWLNGRVDGWREAACVWSEMPNNAWLMGCEWGSSVMASPHAFLLS